MRVKPVHIAVSVLIALTGFMAFAVLRTRTPSAAPSDPAFIEEVRQRQAQVDITAGTGSVMPPDASGVEGPNISVAHTQVTFDNVPNNALSTYPFAITNTGALPLTIYAVKASCECTKGIIPEGGLTIAPGATANMDIQINPYRIPGFDATRYLTLASNDPDTPSLQIDVTTNLVPEYSTDPREVDFGIIDKGSNQQAKIIVRQVQEERLVLEGVDGTAGKEPGPFTSDMTFSYVERPEAEWATPGKAEYEITATLSPDAASGTFTYSMYLKTNIKRLPFYPVYVRAIIEPPYELSPRMPESLAIAGNGTKPGALMVRAKGPVTIENLQFDPAKLTASVRPGDTPDTAYIDANVMPGQVDGQLTEPLRFDVVYDGKTYKEAIFARAFIPPTNPLGAATPPPAEEAPAGNAAVTLDVDAPVVP
jgi:hypothetical protein